MFSAGDNSSVENDCQCESDNPAKRPCHPHFGAAEVSDENASDYNTEN